MDIYYLGLTGIRLKGKKTTIVVDPFEDKEKLGIKMEKTEADGVVISAPNLSYVNTDQVANFRTVFAGPGEYEIGGVSIYGMKAAGTTIYRIKIDGLTLLHLGFAKRGLTETEIDKITDDIDIVFVPVGGGEVMQAKDAAETITKLQPKIAIPTYFSSSATKVKLPMEDIAEFIKAIGKENIAPTSKLSITKDKLPAELEVVWLQ